MSFKSRTGLKFFSGLIFHYCSSSVRYCEDRFHIHISIFVTVLNIQPHKVGLHVIVSSKSGHYLGWERREHLNLSWNLHCNNLRNLLRTSSFFFDLSHNFSVIVWMVFRPVQRWMMRKQFQSHSYSFRSQSCGQVILHFDPFRYVFVDNRHSLPIEVIEQWQ